MTVTKEHKSEMLQELVDKFARTKTVVFADYRGINVKNVSELRNQLRKEQAEFKVSKKTLMRIAIEKNNLPAVEADAMPGTIAAVFSYQDELAAIRILSKFAKKNENLKLIAGIIEGKAIGPDMLKRYAAIPSKEILMAQLVNRMMSPVSGFHSVLHGTLSGFVRAMSAYKDQKAKTETVVVAAPAPAAPAAAAEIPAVEAVPPAPAPTA